MEINKEHFETVCEDGVTLRGVLFIPENPKAVVQFNCGTATKKEVYFSFLTYLAENGFICCAWDYRGSGKSTMGNDLKHCDYRYADYGMKDMPAIKSYLNARFSNLPFIIVGHSTGGQQIGFINDLSNVKGVVNIAVSSGYYPNMPFGYRMNAYFFFYVFAPISVLFNGFVNAKKYKFMENLPKNVAYEWRDWLEKEDYFFDPKFYGKTVPIGHYQDFKFPIHIYWTTDDTISNEKNTKAFWRNIKSEKEITFTRLTAKEFGLNKIDHFGFFKSIMKEKLWTDILVKLNDFLLR